MVEWSKIRSKYSKNIMENKKDYVELHLNGIIVKEDYVTPNQHLLNQKLEERIVAHVLIANGSYFTLNWWVNYRFYVDYIGQTRPPPLNPVSLQHKLKYYCQWIY